MGFVPLWVNHQLAGRIITPIFDVYGELVAVSTRHLYKPKKEAFWHEDFDKSFYLYGFHIAKTFILKFQKAIVVEGEFDTAFLHSSNIKMAVGLCGSALGLFQVSLLARYCTDVYLLYDGDKGGNLAFQRSKELWEEQCQGVVKLIPCRMGSRYVTEKGSNEPVLKGYDPDDFIKENGVNGLVELMKKEKKQFLEMGYF